MITEQEIIAKANSIKQDLEEYKFLKKAHEGIVENLKAEIERLKEENKELRAINNISEPTEEEYQEYEYDRKMGFYKRW